MNIDDDDKNQKEVKKIENIDNTKIKKLLQKRYWRLSEKQLNCNYYGECDQNNVPSGIGRIIAQNRHIFIDGCFKNG